MTVHADVLVQHIEAPAVGRVLVRPARRGRVEGVLAGFHGYAESAEAQMDRLAAIPETDGWVLIAAQALNRFYRGRTQDTVAGWMTRQDREPVIAANMVYVVRAIDWVRRKYDLALAPAPNHVPKAIKGDSRLKVTVPLVYAGFSQGGAMAFRAGVRGTWTASGIMAVGADVPPELLADPNSRFPAILLVRGNRDDWYTRPTFDADVAALTDRCASLTAVVVDGGHEWTSACAAQASHFLRTLVPARDSGR